MVVEVIVAHVPPLLLGSVVIQAERAVVTRVVWVSVDRAAEIARVEVVGDTVVSSAIDHSLVVAIGHVGDSVMGGRVVSSDMAGAVVWSQVDQGVGGRRVGWHAVVRGQVVGPVDIVGDGVNGHGVMHSSAVVLGVDTSDGWGAVVVGDWSVADNWDSNV